MKTKKEVSTIKALGIIAATIAAPAIIYIELLLICAALG